MPDPTNFFNRLSSVAEPEPDPVEPKLFEDLEPEPEPKINLNRHVLLSVWLRTLA